MSCRIHPLRGYPVIFLLLLTASVAPPRGYPAPKPKVDPQLAQRYRAVAGSIDNPSERSL